MWYAIASVSFVIASLVFIWYKVIPKMVDKRCDLIVSLAILDSDNRNLMRLVDYNDQEVEPIIKAISAYAPIIDNIYSLLDKIQDDLDLIASEGQAKKVPIPKTILLPPADVDFDIEEVEDGNFLSPNTLIPHNPLPIVGHTILVGQSGGGKTNALVLAILSFIQAGYTVNLIDAKNELAQILENHIDVHKASDTVKVIRKLIQAAKDRMEHFGNVARELGEPILDVWEYMEITGKTIPIIYLVIEELVLVSDMIDPDELVELFVAGRSSGVFVFAATQDMKTDILPKKCSRNITTRVYLGAPDGMAMRVLFTAGIPDNIKAQAQNHLGPVGKAMVYTSKNGEYTFTSIPKVPREVLKELMQ